jgi:hypothetical protein
MLGLDGYDHAGVDKALERIVDRERAARYGPPLDPLAESEYLRFSLREMFIATTIAAALFALFRAFGIFGALASFAAALLFTQKIYPRIARNNEPRQRLMYDFVWGVVMPIVCLCFDPFVFRDDVDFDQLAPNNLPSLTLGRHLTDTAFIAYAVIGWQILTLAAWLLLGKVARPVAAWFSGTLAVGKLLSLLMGVVLFIPAIFGSLYFGIGLMGLTPLFTADAYSRRTKFAYQLASKERPAAAIGAYWLGVIMAVLVPLAIGLALLVAVRGWDHFVSSPMGSKLPPLLRFRLQIERE